jgi:tetratricopeptide (TPR) repeat protein
LTSGRATGKAIRIERSAIEHWGEVLGGQKYLAELIGRNPSRINQIKNAEAAPADLLEELSAEIAKLIRGERTRLQGRARVLERFETQPTPDQVLASLTGALPVGALLRPAWPFIGRARELAQIGAALDASARGGAGHAFVLSGEAGLGKTTLLRRAADAALRSGARAWIGRCTPTSPHGPWIQILQQCMQDLQPRARSSHAGGPRVPAGILDALRASENGDTARLHRIVWDFLCALSEHAPLFLAIDDLQCADAATLRLWEHCADHTGVSEHRVLLLASSTPDACGPADWTLQGLSAQETAELLEAHAPDTTDPEARSVFRLTRGNPLLIRELCDSSAGLAAAAEYLRHDGATRELPGRSREALERLLLALPPAELHALEAASVLGPRFRPQLLSSLCDAPVGLAAAVRRQLIQPVEAAPGLYELVPGLLRPCLYQRIEPQRLADLHRRAVDALRSEALPASAGELAHHLLRAQGADSAEGIAWAMKAAEGAYARMAYDEAALHYRQALTVVDPQGLLACTLGVGLARAQNRAGHICEADATLIETATLARTLAADHVVCEAALEFGAQAPYILPSSSEYAGMLEEALANAAHDRALRAKLMARLAVTLAISDSERAVALASHALEQAHELRGSDPSTWVYVHAVTYIALLGADRPTCLATEAQVFALAERSRDLELMLRSRRTLVDATLRTAHSVDELQRAVERYAALSQRSKQPESRAWEKIFGSTLELLLGHVDEAEKLSIAAHEIGTRAGDANAYPIRLAQQLAIWLQRRDWERLEQERRTPRQPLWRQPSSALLVCTDAKLGRREHAYHGVEQIAATGYRELRAPLVWPLALWLLAEGLRELDAPRHAAALAEIVAPRSEESLIVGLGVAHLGPVSRCLGLLAEAQKERARAARLFEQALLHAQELGAEPWIAAAQADLARVLLASGRKRDAEHARRLLRSATVYGERLGLCGLVAECRMLGA